MYYTNGLFSGVGRFFKKAGQTITGVAQNIVSGAASLAGGIITGLGVQSITTPIGGATFNPQTGQPSSITGPAGPPVQVGVQVDAKKYLPWIAGGAAVLFLALRGVKR